MFTWNGIGITTYGHKNKQQLSASERIDLEQAGYRPEAYQAVKWFTILWLPIIPLGTYRVMEVAGSRQSKLGGGSRSRLGLVRVPWDWTQVVSHYALGWGIVLLFYFTLQLTEWMAMRSAHQ